MDDENLRFGEPGTTEPPLLDMLASNARTALTDPNGLDLREIRDGVEEAKSYAVDRLDEIINTLNPAEGTRENYALTLTMLGRQLAERADTIEQDEVEYPDHDDETKEAFSEAHTALLQALDALDEAINWLTPEPAA